MVEDQVRLAHSVARAAREGMAVDVA